MAVQTRVLAFDEMGQFENRNKGIRFVGGYYMDIEETSATDYTAV